MPVLVADQGVEEAGSPRVLTSVARDRRTLERGPSESEREGSLVPRRRIVVYRARGPIHGDGHQPVIGLAEALR
jgi:hypothetical protein